MVKRLSDYARLKELEKVSQGFVDVTTGEVASVATFNQLNEHFPQPWENFRHELDARLKQDDIEELRMYCEKLGNYSPEDLAQIKPLFVSRAPQRLNSGAAHKETIYGQTAELAKTNSVTQKVAVENLSLKDLGELIEGVRQNCKLIDPHRNEKLYTAIEEWLKGKEEREKRAKEIEASLGRSKEKRHLTEHEQEEIKRLRALPRKPTKDGSLGPIVRTVTMVIDKLSGIPIRNGIAKNDTMLRVDVFTKDRKYHLVPIYVHHALAKRVEDLPIKAIVANKDELEWTLIDESFAFCFSLYPNDFVRISQKGKAMISGYYISCHRGTGCLNLWAHDRSSLVGKDGAIEGVGVKTALSFEKYNVDELGNIYHSKKEVRSMV